MDLPEHHVWAIQCLGELAEVLANGGIAAFNLTTQGADGRITKSTFVSDTKGFDYSRLCVETMAHGKMLLRQASARQGNAPLQNRSAKEQ